jgi:hypothetical protein
MAIAAPLKLFGPSARRVRTMSDSFWLATVTFVMSPAAASPTDRSAVEQRWPSSPRRVRLNGW